MLPTLSGSTPAPQVFMSAKRNCSNHFLACASAQPPSPSSLGSPATQNSSHYGRSRSPTPRRYSYAGRSHPLSVDGGGVKRVCAAGDGSPAGGGVGVGVLVGAGAGDGARAGDGVRVGVLVGAGAGDGAPARGGVGVSVRVGAANEAGVRVGVPAAGGVGIEVPTAVGGGGAAGAGGEISSRASTKGESPSESKISSTSTSSSTSSSDITTGPVGENERDGKGTRVGGRGPADTAATTAAAGNRSGCGGGRVVAVLLVGVGGDD
jgi:hypothetical protein